jgi:hypothetical protein
VAVVLLVLAVQAEAVEPTALVQAAELHVREVVVLPKAATKRAAAAVQAALGLAETTETVAMDKSHL